MLGVASYRGTLNLKICAEGLYLQVNSLFKIAHPPLLSLGMIYVSIVMGLRLPRLNWGTRRFAHYATLLLRKT